MGDTIQGVVLYISMFCTKHFFLSSAVFIVFVIVLLALIFDKEPLEQEVSTSELVIVKNPQNIYSVANENVENFHMRRAIFIEKIRNALPDLTLSLKTEVVEKESQNIEEPVLQEEPIYQDELIFQAEPKTTIPASTSTNPGLSTSTPEIDTTQSSSTTASSSSAAEDVLISI